MSRFYASVQGPRGLSTRQGTKESGLQAHIRGWNIGARVTCYVGEDGKDHVAIWLTAGSNGYKFPDKLLGEFSED